MLSSNPQQATPIVPAFDLKVWRSEQLAQVKTTHAYRQLAPIQRRIVDHIIRKYLSPLEGAFPRQATLAQRFDVTRETINRHMSAILATGIFTSEPRYRGAGTPGGRTSNRLFVNPVLLSLMATNQSEDVTQPLTQPVTQPVTAEGSNQVEGLPPKGEDQVEGSSQVEDSGAIGEESIVGAKAPLTLETRGASQLIAPRAERDEVPVARSTFGLPAESPLLPWEVQDGQLHRIRDDLVAVLGSSVLHPPLPWIAAADEGALDDPMTRERLWLERVS